MSTTTTLRLSEASKQVLKSLEQLSRDYSTIDEIVILKGLVSQEPTLEDDRTILNCIHDESTLEYNTLTAIDFLRSLVKNHTDYLVDVIMASVELCYWIMPRIGCRALKKIVICMIQRGEGDFHFDSKWLTDSEDKYELVNEAIKHKNGKWLRLLAPTIPDYEAYLVERWDEGFNILKKLGIPVRVGYDIEKEQLIEQSMDNYHSSINCLKMTLDTFKSIIYTLTPEQRERMTGKFNLIFEQLNDELDRISDEIHEKI